MAQTAPEGRRSRDRFLSLFALSSLVVAQPLFDLLAKTPEFFVTRDTSPGELWLLVLLLAFGLPGALGLAGALVERALGPQAAAVFDHLIPTLAAAAFVLQALRKVSFVSAWIPALSAAACGIAFAIAYAKKKPVRFFVAVLAPLALLIPIFFVSSPQIRKLLFDPDHVYIPESFAVARPVPVVVVVFDELPLVSLLDAERRIDARLFPNFARVAATSTWYPNATSPANLTLPALASILTGNDPRPDLLPTAEDHRRNLFTLLDSSHDLFVSEPMTNLLPTRRGKREPLPRRMGRLAADLGVVYLHATLPRRFTSWLPDVALTWDFGAGETEATNRSEVFRRFVASLETTERPSLVFLHSLLPHHPWIYFPSGKRYDNGTEVFVDALAEEAKGSLNTRWLADPWPVMQAYQRHLLQLCFTDKLLGELLAKLDELDLFDPALFILVADHGIHIAPGGRVRAVDPESYHGIASVPLFVKEPHQREARVDGRAAETIDIVPTVADTLGVEPEWRMDGGSLFSPEARRPRQVYVTKESAPLPLSDVVSSNEENLAVKLGVFGRLGGGEGYGPPDLYHLGPRNEELLGRLLPEVPAVASRGFTARVDKLERFARVDRSRDPIPGKVTGAFLGDPGLPPRPALALALNGVIRAVTLTRRREGNAHAFSMMIPETHLRDGANELALFAVAPGDPVALEPIRLEPPVGYRLAGSAGQAWIESSDGRRHPLEPSKFEGEFRAQMFHNLNYQLELFGWAIDDSSGEAPERVLIFSDGRFVDSTSLNYQRSGLRFRYDLSGREHCGFIVCLPAEYAAGSVRLFAVAHEGPASELPFLGTFMVHTEDQ